MTIRAAADVLIALALALPAPSAAQGRDKGEAHDFLLFLQSVESQRPARMWERGVPGHRRSVGRVLCEIDHAGLKE